MGYVPLPDSWVFSVLGDRPVALHEASSHVIANTAWYAQIFVVINTSARGPISERVEEVGRRVRVASSIRNRLA